MAWRRPAFGFAPTQRDGKGGRRKEERGDRRSSCYSYPAQTRLSPLSVRRPGWGAGSNVLSRDPSAGDMGGGDENIMER